jgi:hypothetical protein
MPLLSAFTPCGHLKLSGNPSRAESLYKSLVAALSPSFDMTQGTRQEAWAYAMAMTMARAQNALERAGNQSRPLLACDLIPLLEQAYLVVPSPGETLPQRQATLAAIDAISSGGRFPDIVSGLRSLLGSVFLALVPTSEVSPPTTWPVSPATGGGNWVDPRTEFLSLQTVDPLVGSSWVAYEPMDLLDQVTTTWLASQTFAQAATIIPTSLHATGYFYQCSVAGVTGTTEPAWPTTIGQTIVDGTATWTCADTTVPLLNVGQTITIQAENSSAVEQVVVLAVSLTPQGFASQGPCFEASFNNPHDAGSTIVTGPFPLWTSTQRLLLVVLAGSSASDRQTRRKVDEFMRKICRADDIWAIVTPDTTMVGGGTVSGGVVLNGPMGTQPLGPLSPYVDTP